MAAIILFGGTFAPRDWALCQGQTLSIQSNTALFSLIGTTYGGNGQTTFQLPDLRGRVPVGVGKGNGLQETWTLGEMGGVENVTLNVNQLPQHTHTLGGALTLQVSQAAGSNPTPQNGNFLAAVTDGNAEFPAYNTGTAPLVGLGGVSFSGGAIGNAGGNQPHTNLQPSLALNYIIAVRGLYPPRD